MSNRIGPRHPVVAGFLFLLPTVILVLTQGNSGYDAERGVTRFLNAFLTSYTIASVFFVVNMFQYSKSREEPTAPWVSMVYAATLGIFVTFLLTNQGGFLMEENGSQRAQILYNIVHFIVTSSAILMAAGILILLCFVNLKLKDDKQS